MNPNNLKKQIAAIKANSKKPEPGSHEHLYKGTKFEGVLDKEITKMRKKSDKNFGKRPPKQINWPT